MKLKKLLSIILVAIMVFSTEVVAFAADETKGVTSEMYLRVSGETSIGRGESTEVTVKYNSEKLDNIKFVWSTEGDACNIEYFTDDESGLVTSAKITSVTYGYYYIKVDMVSEDGKIIESDKRTIFSNVPEDMSLQEKIEYKMSEFGANLMFVVFLILNVILEPIGHIFNLFK